MATTATTKYRLISRGAATVALAYALVFQSLVALLLVTAGAAASHEASAWVLCRPVADQSSVPVVPGEGKSMPCCVGACFAGATLHGLPPAVTMLVASDRISIVGFELFRFRSHVRSPGIVYSARGPPRSA